MAVFSCAFYLSNTSIRIQPTEDSPEPVVHVITANPTPTQTEAPVEKAATVVAKDFAAINHFDTEIAGIVSRNHYKNPAYETVLANSGSSEDLQNYLNSLDPYSRLISSDQFRFIEIRAKSERTGPGLDYLIGDGTVLGVPVFGAPLYRSGQKNALLIESVNRHKINYSDFDSFRFLNDFRDNDSITLAFRENAKAPPESVTLRASTYKYQPVRFYKTGKTTVLEIRTFRTGNNRTVRDALQSAVDSDRLVVDLRFSPGGDIYAMTDWLSLFLPEGQEVARLVKHNGQTPLVLKTLSGKVTLDIPVVILISRYTASSAEIFARVLASSLPNTLTAGEHTRGKCLAQNVFRLKNGDVLSLSTYEVELSGSICNNTSLNPTISIPGVEFSDLSALMREF